jgi:glycosyltransferase involved in cell wall biosynthesis
MSLSACFVLRDVQLSGGVSVILKHARGLASTHGMDVTIALTLGQQHAWPYPGLTELPVVPLAEARRRSYDIAVATWWETAFEVFSVPARRRAYFVQSLEDRFYPPGHEERGLAGATTGLPVSFITEATWIQRTLRELRPDADCFLVRNGVDKDVFALPEELPVRADGPLRVIVEGSPGAWFKGIDEAAAVISATREPCAATFVTPVAGGFGHNLPPGEVVGPVSREAMATLYASHDVVLKTSRVEGMYSPPLEGFHCGATCVTTPVTGHDEYVRHGWNGVVVDWDDVRGAARWLDTLARDPRRLHFLRLNAVETARGWPSWSQSTDFLATALRTIVRRPPPDGAGGAAALAAALRSEMADFRRLQQRKSHEYVQQFHVDFDRVRRERDDLTQRLAGATQGLDDLHASASWRLTRPLRTAKRAVKRLAGQPPRRA